MACCSASGNTPEIRSTVIEAAGIAMQLTLVDNAILVRVKKLDWVLNRENVIGMQFVDQINNCGQRRRLSRAGWPGHQHNTVAQPSDILQLHRQIQLLKLGTLPGITRITT